LLAFPPVVRGQAAAGEDPGLAVAVGTVVAETLGRAVAVAVAEGAPVGFGDREADTRGVGVADVPASGWGPHALTITMPRAKASAA
jgi:hypothetical protein